MPHLLSAKLVFPDPKMAGENDVIAVGGDLSVERLLLAYKMGLFPWFNEDEPILWWSPDPRCLLYPEDLKVAKSMRPYLNQEKYRLTCDQAFKEVVASCSLPRSGQEGTWITQDIINAYTELHEKGYAHSVEVWEGNQLVGGLYGVSLGACFFGESMFSKAKNASKLALIKLMHALSEKGFHFIDCQIYNDHLGTLGACEISREDFLQELADGLKAPTLKGDWSDLI